MQWGKRMPPEIVFSAACLAQIGHEYLCPFLFQEIEPSLFKLYMHAHWISYVLN